MRATRRFIEVTLGVILVFHGLANAVLPLRGVGFGTSWMPFYWSLSALAIVGFVAAGLGLLHIRPLRPHVVAYVWAAGLCSLIAHLVRPEPDLWAGLVLSVTLPPIASLYALSVPDDERTMHPVWRAFSDAAALGFLVWIGVSAVTFPVHRAWGTTPAEWTLALPGDESPRLPQYELQHAVTINAPPSRVWPWLVQIGQDRGGFYSYDWLERLFGADIHNADVVRRDWQTIEVGDYVPATQPRYAGGLFGEQPGWIVDAVEPERALVLRRWGAFVLVPQADGTTRLLVRSTISDRRIPAWAAGLNLTAFQLPHFIMQRRMLLGIKARAEGAGRS